MPNSYPRDEIFNLHLKTITDLNPLLELCLKQNAFWKVRICFQHEKHEFCLTGPIMKK